MPSTKEKISLKRADYPEQVGVPSKEIEAFIEDCKENNIEVHSLMIMSKGEVAFESWAAPYSPEIPHAMYSVSKTFTSAAIGFAVSEGLISVDTKLIEIFPEFMPEKRDDNLELLTIHSLLTMQSGKNVSVFADKTKPNWEEDFFNAPWGFTPCDGHWQYVSENQYMLCSVIHRVTGMSVVQYLTPRLFEPLGIEPPEWERSPSGVEAGGWGLFIKTEDLAKFVTCYQHDGVFNGKQVIPAEWVHQTRRRHADNSTVNKSPDSQCGYGYCVWHCAGAPAYRMDGMFSQFGIVFKDRDASFIITAGEIDEQKTRDAIWRHFPKAFIEPDSEPAPDHEIALAPLDDILPPAERSPLESQIAGERIVFSKNLILNTAGFPVSMLPIPVVYMSAYKGGNITNVVFEFGENECTMTWDEGDEHNSIVCGMDGEYRTSRIRLAHMNFTAYSTAAWEDENTLVINMRPVESVCRRTIKFTFDGDNVIFRPSSQQSINAMAENLALDVDNFFPGFLQKFGQIAFDQLPKIIDSVHKGYFADKKEKKHKKDKKDKKDKEEQEEQEEKEEK